jgi:hypothetical protein
VEAFVFLLLLLLVLRKQLLCAFLSLIFLCGMMPFFVVGVLPTLEDEKLTLAQRVKNIFSSFIEVHCSVHDSSLPLNTVSSRMNPLHILKYYFFHINVMLPSYLHLNFPSCLFLAFAFVYAPFMFRMHTAPNLLCTLEQSLITFTTCFSMKHLCNLLAECVYVL